MRGKLVSAQSLLFGKAGRAMLTHFSELQYSRSRGRLFPLSAELTDVIPWWMTAMGRLAPRRLLFQAQKPVVLYTDAAGSGHVGAVAIYEGVSYTASTHLPDWLTEHYGIFEFETAWSWFGLLLDMEIAYGTPVILFCDNAGAEGVAIRRYAKTRGARYVWNILGNGRIFRGISFGGSCAVPVEYRGPPHGCVTIWGKRSVKYRLGISVHRKRPTFY